MQPSNVTVLTGIALDTSDSDRVHVILRKDTSRGRYRTTILVNDVIRYFDHMQLQRFRGCSLIMFSEIMCCKTVVNLLKLLK